MARPMSRSERKVAFMKQAEQMFEELENWYDENPAASFEEIEEQARRARRKMMGESLGVVINGRDVGKTEASPGCGQCGRAMVFKDYRAKTIYGLEGETELERAYYVCEVCEKQTFFPLDKKLKLRQDHWSSGMARVAVRQGLQATSFKLAAASLSDATGCDMSGEGVRQVTQGWGERVAGRREKEAEAVFEPKQSPAQAVEVVDPIEKQASLSTDGGMVHVRGQGWKEVKLVVISSVRLKKETEKGAHPDGRRYKPYEPQLMLEKHSYQAGLWTADEMGQHQYLEGLRRNLGHCSKVSSANDGAQWIERITSENFPQVTQIVDWFHATEKMWHIGKQTIPNQSERAAWVGQRLDDLWLGRLPTVNAALTKVDTSQALDRDELAMSIGYFQRQQERMKYHQYRIAGYPIGSGSVESGINNVVHHRMKRQGRGWQRHNVNPMLAALSELHSDRFERMWASTQ